MKIYRSEFDRDVTFSGPDLRTDTLDWNFRLETFRRGTTGQILGHRVHIEAPYKCELAWPTAHLPGGQTVQIEILDAQYPFYFCA